jgi:large subunit ribosomal protein L30e
LASLAIVYCSLEKTLLRRQAISLFLREKMSSKKAAASTKPKKAEKEAAPAKKEEKTVKVKAASVEATTASKPTKGGDSVASKLALVMKSGKVALGYKSTLKQIRNGKAKAILVASNCPPLRRSEIEYLSMLTKTTLHHYSGTNKALGVACGKFFSVSVMSVTESGDSDLLTYLESQ